MPSGNVTRVRETYHAYEHGQLERIPELFAPEGFYRTSGVFVGMADEYRGHARIEVGRTAEYGDCVVAEAIFEGIGAESGLEVKFAAGHLIRFRDGLIVEFLGFASWEQALEAAQRPSTV